MSDQAALRGASALMSGVLDRERLTDVLRGNPSSAAAFLAEFRETTETDTRQLLDAAGTGDLAQVELLAHRMEGASRVIGAGPLAVACSELASACRSREFTGLGDAVQVFLERKCALETCLDALVAEERAPAAPQAGRGSDQICGGLVFLVVEDNPFQRGVIMRLLRQLGALEVHGFEEGASALAAARTVRGPAVLVLDLAMPTLNGMDVMRIAAQEQLSVAVIMNSAMGEDLLRWPLHTARAYGGNILGAVSKPLTAAKLAPLLAELRHGMHIARSNPPPLP